MFNAMETNLLVNEFFQRMRFTLRHNWNFLFGHRLIPTIFHSPLFHICHHQMKYWERFNNDGGREVYTISQNRHSTSFWEKIKLWMQYFTCPQVFNKILFLVQVFLRQRNFVQSSIKVCYIPFQMLFIHCHVINLLVLFNDFNEC